MRQNEFLGHPLWSKLELHATELSDFIKKKKEEQAILRARESN